MESHYISLKPLDDDWIELRYGPVPKNYQSLRLQFSEIQALLDRGNFSYYTGDASLGRAGHELFCWLDGETRWLSRTINECSGAGLALAIAAEGRLQNLPWEVLHDGKEFLVERERRPIVPIRWVELEMAEEPPVQSSTLRIVFMATSPEGVRPVLEFEEEEARILKITKELPLELRVQESGDLKELAKMWRRFPRNTFQVFHLSGHASFDKTEPYCPYFIAETLTGEPKKVRGKELLESFGNRLPSLVFLSGCRTGQSRDGGAVSSMGETLVREGIPSVMCWGDLVRDSTATLAAAHLYQLLTEGHSIAEAMGSTYRELRTKDMTDWHLMRLYAEAEAWRSLTVAPGEYVSTYERIQMQFLDAKKKVRVATPEEFVGRRRLLQNCLRQLRAREYLGLLLYGLGGVGKSTVAARLLERLVGYSVTIIHGRLSLEEIEGSLKREYLCKDGHYILKEGLPPSARLTRLLRFGLQAGSRRICFVLDSFEANLKAQCNGEQVLRSSAVEPLMVLLRSVTESRAGHRVIITSRYDVKLPELDHRLYRKQVTALRRADVTKKCRRLKAFGRKSGVEVELQEKGKRIADGNPRLLERLNGVLLVEGLENKEIIGRMMKEETNFRESILAEELIKQQSDELVNMLWCLQIFELPIPEAAISEVCDDIVDEEKHRERAVALGLLEASEVDGDRCYRVPQVLANVLPAKRKPARLIEKAADSLYKVWGEQSGIKSEEQLMEMYRLGKMAGSEEICIAIGRSLVNSWKKEGRYREAIPVGYTVLEMRKRVLGDEHPDVAKSLSNLAYLFYSQGRHGEAEPLFVEALEMRKRVLGKEHPDVATSLNNLAYLYYSQRRYSEAEPLYVEALEIRKRVLGPQHLDVVASSHNLARLRRARSRVSEAEPL